MSNENQQTIEDPTTTAAAPAPEKKAKSKAAAKKPAAKTKEPKEPKKTAKEAKPKAPKKTAKMVFQEGGKRNWMIPRLKTAVDRKSTRLNSSHSQQSRMPSSA